MINGGKNQSVKVDLHLPAENAGCAIWCDYDPETLAANLGDDADTTGAITGQLAGAIYGCRGLPQDWVDRVAW